MKKKVLSICLVVALVAIAAISTTLAYFTDTDAQHNTMVIGNIDIDQFEKQLDVDENGNTILADFVDPTAGMMPAAGATAYADERLDLSGLTVTGEYADDTFVGKSNLWADYMNAEEKIVFVKNTGKNDVYFRTIILVEYPEEIDAFGLICNSAYDYNLTKDGVQNSDNTHYYDNVVVNGINYYAFVATYVGDNNGVLAPNTVSYPSLVQLAMYSNMTQEDMAKFGEKADILCFSQAVQTNGFENATAALNAAFGEPSVATIGAWAAEMFPTV